MGDYKRSLRQPDCGGEGLNGKPYFRKIFPKLDMWLSKRERAAALICESQVHERRAAVWEGRGHFERAAKEMEDAALPVRELLDFELTHANIARYAKLLKLARGYYDAELGTAGRYDPALFFRTAKLSRDMGDAIRMRADYERMMDGFRLMVEDRNLDNLVRLNRLKREFLRELWGGSREGASAIVEDALRVAAMVRAGKADRRRDTEAWLDAQLLARYGKGLENAPKISRP
ncbi:MAG: hypothetical protein AB1324_06140 [Candidatus Micrarchaeota archaeon]